MTIVREDATFCGECRKEADAYYKGMRAMWAREFFIQHEREPTDEEMMVCAPSPFGPALGPNGYPDCSKCQGLGVYIENADGTTRPGGLLSATIYGSGYAVSESVIAPCEECGEPVPGALRTDHARSKHGRST